MTDEASEFLRDEMRGDCMAMIEHQEREIADLREQLAEKQERIEELDAQISEIHRAKLEAEKAQKTCKVEKSSDGYGWRCECGNFFPPSVPPHRFCPNCGRRVVE